MRLPEEGCEDLPLVWRTNVISGVGAASGGSGTEGDPAEMVQWGEGGEGTSETEMTFELSKVTAAVVMS